jgi:hypothetical protein
MLAVYILLGLAAAGLVYRLGYAAGRRNGRNEAGQVRKEFGLVTANHGIRREDAGSQSDQAGAIGGDHAAPQTARQRTRNQG